MPASPWRSVGPVDPAREYLTLLSSLPVRRAWRILWFLWQTFRIVRQLEHAHGLVGYSLNAQPLTKRFWTLSVWEDEDALRAFVGAPPHARIMRALVPHVGQTRFVRWRIRGGAIPPSWGEALRR